MPEQFSFEAEKELIRTLGRRGMMQVQVYSFQRLAYKIFQEDHVAVHSLGKSGKAMLLYDIMLTLEKDLMILKQVEKHPGVIETVADQIAELKRYQITPELLKGITVPNEYLKRKLQDLALIYEEYEKRIQEDYIDTNDELTLLAEVLKTDSYLQGAKIWIDEFDGFTPQELSVIRELFQKADVTIAMIQGKEDFFQFNEKNLLRLQQIAKDLGLTWKEITLTTPYRFQNEELQFLEATYETFPVKVYDKEVTHLHLRSYAQIQEELEGVAQTILQYVRTSSLRFENIAVLTRDIEPYRNSLERLFTKYQIPYFFDDKKELSLQPMMTLVNAVLECCHSNYSYESMFTYLKTGLTNIEDENDIDRIENYVLKWGIRGKTWESPFTIEDPNLEQLNQIRERIITPLQHVKQQFAEGKTVQEEAEILFRFLEALGVPKKMEAKVAEFQATRKTSYVTVASEYAQVWNLLLQILDEMVEALGKVSCSLERFQAIFKMGIANHEMGIIPPTKDKVMIGDIDRTRNNEIQVLWILGMNDGVFPKAVATEGFLNDQDRAFLREQGVELAKDTKALLLEEKFHIYKALSVPRQELYLSYSISDLEGKTMRPSFLLTQLKKRFPKWKEKSHLLSPEDASMDVYTPEATFPHLLQQLRRYHDTGMMTQEWKQVYAWYQKHQLEKLQRVTPGLSYVNTVERQSEAMAKRLYGETMHASVSKLERYVQCPYSFYLQYGLQAKEREVYRVGTPDVGTFLHEIIDHFSKKLLAKEIEIRTLDRETCDAIVGTLVDQEMESFRHQLFQSTGKLRKLSARLKQLVRKTIWWMVLQLQAGDFQVLGSEVEFGQGKEIPAIEIDLGNQNRLVLNGKVDRMDMAETEEGKYLRIVDYKSSEKKIKLSDVYYGIQLQLLTYMDAVKPADVKPGGIFYLHLSDPILRTTKNLSKEEAEEQILQSLRMNGMVLANVKLIQAMDHHMENESSVLNLKMKKDGSYGNMPVITEEEWQALQKHLHKTLTEIGKEIMAGKISNEPLKRKNATFPCEYCRYHLVCQFDPDLGNRARYLKELKDDEVWEKVAKEQE